MTPTVKPAIRSGLIFSDLYCLIHCGMKDESVKLIYYAYKNIFISTSEVVLVLIHRTCMHQTVLPKGSQIQPRHPGLITHTMARGMHPSSPNQVQIVCHQTAGVALPFFSD